MMRKEVRSPSPTPYPFVLQSVSPADSKRLLWPPQDLAQRNPRVKLPNPTCQAGYQGTHYYKLMTMTVLQSASWKQNTEVLRPSFAQPLSLVISHTTLHSIPQADRHARACTCTCDSTLPSHFLHTHPACDAGLWTWHQTRHAAPMSHTHIRLHSIAFVGHHDLGALGYHHSTC